ncbi:Six-hairpin glycosidase [Mollisia scopiformis]|uniref:Six-hairpin glycosidase n=1 Tax=Mollisia scopiformis TaxID=149040 RepID=A0A194XL42_MOLSC|nr:Six-hairpin glycosidase [Mollisia scopiformis]KUJ20814.1 Six-hairpin glycosidase [Mollisia scopiformis]
MSIILGFESRSLGEGLCDLTHCLCFNLSSYINSSLPASENGTRKQILLALFVMMNDKFRQLLFVSVAVSQLSTVATADYTSNAEATFTTLQKWYDNSTGIYDTTGWWNSANALTTLGDLAALDSKVKSQVTSVLANSIVAAQNYNLQQTKVITPDFNQETFMGSNVPANVEVEAAINPKGFLNGYYDDEGWWALNWIQAYDITGNQDYLTTAVDIFNDMMNGTEPKCGGGIWWDKKNTYVNAIANELYLSVAAHLANRMGSQKQFYTNIATKQWQWFQSTGMINSQNTINDGLNFTTCKNNGGTVWSYNQGVVLGALVELDKASPNSSYLTSAKNIATAAIKALGDSNGVLHDPCEPNCGADGSQFKGIFMRNLQILQGAAPDATYLSFIASNANSIWTKDRDSTNELSVDWSGPFVTPANASTQSSALDSLVAAVAYQSQIGNGIASRS